MTSNSSWNAAYNNATGALLVGNGTRPIVRTVGTNGQVLTADSTQSDGVTYQFVNGTFVGGMTFAAGDRTFDFTAFAPYNTYLFVLNNQFPAVNGDTIFARISEDGGATYIAVGYQSGVNHNPFNSAVITNANSATQFVLSGGVHVSGGGGGVCGFFRYWGNSYTPAETMDGCCTYEDTSTNTMHTARFGGQFAGTLSPTNIKITAAGGLNSFGSINVFGMPN